MQALALIVTLLAAPDTAALPAPLTDEALALEAAGAAPGQGLSVVRTDDGFDVRITLDGATPSPAPSLSNLTINSDPASLVQAQLQLSMHVTLDLGGR